METEPRPTILCVDDEPQVLEGLALHLRRKFGVVTAVGGAAALELLRRDGPVAVIMSDMRMPQMDGAQFLSQVRQLMPNAVRLLLTGQTDLTSAISAVNDGQIFRFLTKPCPPAALMAAVSAAFEQHRLITAERVLLEQTLHGSVKALTDILALANPATFGRALRIKRHASDLCDVLRVSERWQIEVAAMFSQLGLITLPAEIVEKVHRGSDLSDAERLMVDRLPAVTEQLLGQIPRLDNVRAILAAYPQGYRPADSAAKGSPAAAIHEGAHVLRVAVDFDALESQGSTPSRTLATMRGRASEYDPAILDALATLLDTRGDREEIREVSLASLKTGMVLADDVMLVAGPMLVARGYEVTDRFVERARNFSRGSVKEPVRILIRPSVEKVA